MSAALARSAPSRSPRSRTRASRTAASTSSSPDIAKDSKMPYADPDALVSTEFLAAHLDDPSICIVDGSFKMPGVTPTAAEDYARQHIPGAVFFDINAIADHANTLPHMLPQPEKFAADMERLGVGDDQRVIVYDSAGLMSAARVWWMLRVFGHDRVAVLDGGLPKWLAEGRPLR